MLDLHAKNRLEPFRRCGPHVDQIDLAVSRRRCAAEVVLAQKTVDDRK